MIWHWVEKVPFNQYRFLALRFLDRLFYLSLFGMYKYINVLHL